MAYCLKTNRVVVDSLTVLLRSTLKSFGFAFAFYLLGVQSVRSETTPEMIERIERAVIKIEVEAEKRETLGSGFIVDAKGIAITNAHVVKNAKNAYAIFPDGRTVAVTGVYLFDQSRDLAVIQLNQSGYETIPIAKTLPAKGTTLLAFGSPAGLSFTVTRGIVSAIRSAEEMRNEIGLPEANGTWVQCDVPLSPGNSGGPLIDESGNVVAVSTLASTGQAQNLNFGISAVDLQSVIKESQKKTLQKLVLGTQVSQGIRDPLFGMRPPGFDPFKSKQQNYKSVIASIPDEVVKEYVLHVKTNIAKIRPEISQTILSYKQELKKVQARIVKKKPTEPDKSKSGKGFGNPSTLPSITYDSLEEKKQAIDAIETRIEKLQALLAKGSENTPDGLLNIIVNCSGRNVNPSTKYSVGRMLSADVVSAMDEHQLAIKFEIEANQRRDGILLMSSTQRYSILEGKQITLEPQRNPLDEMQRRMEQNMGIKRVPVLSPKIDHLFTKRLEPMLVFVADETTIKVSSASSVSLPTFCEVPISQLKHVIGRITSSSNDPTDAKTVSKSSAKSDFRTRPNDELAGPSTQLGSEKNFRVWSDKSGSFKLKAKLISVKADQVTLEKEDGKIIQIELGKLSLEDQEFVREQ